MLVVYVMPIIVELMFLPFIFLDNNGTLSLIEMIISTFVIPIYLITISYKVLNKFNTKTFFLILIVMLAITVFCIIIEYFNWGITTRNLLKPDSETVLIIQVEMIVASIIVTIGWIAVYFIKRKNI